MRYVPKGGGGEKGKRGEEKGSLGSGRERDLFSNILVE